jgi:hypothetical protein
MNETSTPLLDALRNALASMSDSEIVTLTQEGRDIIACALRAWACTVGGGMTPDANPVHIVRDALRRELLPSDLDVLCASELAELRDLLDHWWHVVEARLKAQRAAKEEESE